MTKVVSTAELLAILYSTISNLDGRIDELTSQLDKHKSKDKIIERIQTLTNTKAEILSVIKGKEEEFFKSTLKK